MSADITRNCKCWKCSQGFCHFCGYHNLVVEPVIVHQSYRYLEGCGRRPLPTIPGHPSVTILVSACKAHNTNHMLSPKENHGGV